MATKLLSARILIECRLQEAFEGDPGACFDIGVAHSSGTAPEVNLIEAHKWFNLAALAGYGPAEKCRANLAMKMSAREIAEARRRARLVQRSNVWQVARFCASAFA